jgi:hypothetical protein
VPETCVVSETPESVPPKVSEPDVVTVPVSVRPFTVPVPATEFTVPAPIPDRAVACVVPPVPPLATGSAVPERVTANVPDPVIGEPATDRNEGTDIATDVTVPLFIAAILIAPVPLVIAMPVPAVRVALVSVLPVVFPIRSCPLV